MSAADGKPLIAHNQSLWLGGKKFQSGNAGRTHIIDAGALEAPGPVEALLGAIATCSAVDVVDILAKRRTPVERLEIHVAGHRRGEAPRRLMRLEMEYLVDGAGIEAEHAQRAIQLAFEKYCSVGASLAPDIEVQAVLVLNGERLAPVALTVWSPA